MDHRLIAPYNPRADGKVERSIGTVMSIIKKLLDGTEKHWPLYVPFAQLSFNNKVSALTNSTPFALMFGRSLNELKDHSIDEGRTMIDLDDWKEYQDKIVSLIYPAIADRTHASKTKMAKMLDSHRRVLLPSSFPADSIVMLKDQLRSTKFEPKYVGPYTIVRRTRNGNYLLRDETGDPLDRPVPPDQLKLVSKKPRRSDNQDDVFEVHHIVEHRGQPGSYEYLVRWKPPYGDEDDTWEPPSSFKDSGIIKRYWTQQQPSTTLPLRA